MPSLFLERLCDTNWVFAHIDPDAPQNKRATDSAVVMQLAPDVRRKLQKLEVFEGINRSQLSEIAQEVHNSRG